MILTSTLTLLGLVAGFTLSMAVTRYEQRKLYEAEEANTIGTEYLRLDLLPPTDRDRVQKLLREYLQERIHYYEARSLTRLQEVNAKTVRLQSQLWEGVRAPSLTQPSALTALAVSGMNEVLDAQGYTQAAFWSRVPIEAWVLLGMIAACSNLMLGLYLRVIPTSRLLMVLPAILAVSFLLISDIDSPRFGLVHILPVNLEDVRDTMQ